MNKPLHKMEDTSASALKSDASGTRRGVSGKLAMIAVLFCAFALDLFHASAADPTVAKEYQIKAAFIFNFTKFVEWPEARLAADDSPILIGVMGASPFGAELERCVKDRKINAHPIVVKSVETLEEAQLLHLVFIPAGEKGRMAEIIPKLHASHVLTVGDTEQFANADGIINFVLEGDKVRFEINLDSASKAGLKISAQLLKLAKVVRKSAKEERAP